MSIVNINELSEIRKKFKKVVFCSGSFDLTHAGHVLFFEDCKRMGDVLVVGVGSDAIIKNNKGDWRPILNESARMKMIDSIKPVDYVILDNISTKENNLKLLEVMFEKLSPDIYVVNEDAFNMSYREDLARKFRVKLEVLSRVCPKEFEDISTSKIIAKIRAIR